MNEHDLAIFNAWFRGDSIGSIAKRYKLDKSQIKKVINRVSKERTNAEPKVLHELHDNQANTGRNL